MMDGYALRAADTPGRLEVIGRIAAGQSDLPPIGEGQAAWINTGAPLPPGADAVVPVERTRGEVEVLEATAPGDHVLSRGTLVDVGGVVAEGVLTPERIAACAAQGCDPVEVLRRPKVAVLATGSELKPAPGAHEIRNSNGPMLLALLRGAGAETVDLGVAHDEHGALAAALERGLAEADVLLTTGGVSKGDLDLVRPALEQAGVEVAIHGVALQPGKPVLFGGRDRTTVFGLPGNPASALVCADLFVLPHLAVLRGRGFDEVLASRRARISGPVRSSPKRRRVFPCILHGDRVDPMPWRSSADLYTLGRSNAYMVIETGLDVSIGAEVECLVPERFARS
jgi:molybdopterin molybdotransferase